MTFVCCRRFGPHRKVRSYAKMFQPGSNCDCARALTFGSRRHTTQPRLDMSRLGSSRSHSSRTSSAQTPSIRSRSLHNPFGRFGFPAHRRWDRTRARDPHSTSSPSNPDTRRARPCRRSFEHRQARRSSVGPSCSGSRLARRRACSGRAPPHIPRCTCPSPGNWCPQHRRPRRSVQAGRRDTGMGSTYQARHRMRPPRRLPPRPTLVREPLVAWASRRWSCRRWPSHPRRTSTPSKRTPQS